MWHEYGRDAYVYSYVQFRVYSYTRTARVHTPPPAKTRKVKSLIRVPSYLLHNGHNDHNDHNDNDEDVILYETNSSWVWQRHGLTTQPHQRK